MTLDLLLFFVSLGLMAAVVLLRKPVGLLAAVTVGQWYVGAELLDHVSVGSSSELTSALIEVGFRLSLPLIGLLLLKRQVKRPNSLQLLLIVVWGIVIGGLLLQLLLPVLSFRSGYFYLLLETNQVQLLAGLIGLGFASHIGGRQPKSKR